MLNRRTFISTLIATGVLFATKVQAYLKILPHKWETVKVIVKNSAEDTPHEVEIDKEIAQIVKALQDAGVYTTSSCAGHDMHDGYIRLQDRLLIISQETGQAAEDRYFYQFEKMSREFYEYHMAREKYLK